MLAELQKAFSHDILHQSNGLDRSQAQPNDYALEDYAGKMATMPSRIKIYQDNYRVSLCDALLSSHPLVTKLIGQPYMMGLLNDYVLSHPPHSGDISIYGEDLADYISQRSELSHLAFLGDLARYEYQLDQIGLKAAPAHSLDLSLLQQTPPEHYPQLIFELSPALTLFKSQYAIASLIAQIENNSLQHFDFSSPQSLVIFKRTDNQRYQQQVNPKQIEALEVFSQNQPLHTFPEPLLQRLPQIMSEFAQQEWLIGFTAEGENNG